MAEPTRDEYTALQDKLLAAKLILSTDVTGTRNRATELAISRVLNVTNTPHVMDSRNRLDIGSYLSNATVTDFISKHAAGDPEAMADLSLNGDWVKNMQESFARNGQLKSNRTAGVFDITVADNIIGKNTETAIKRYYTDIAKQPVPTLANGAIDVAAVRTLFTNPDPLEPSKVVIPEKLPEGFVLVKNQNNKTVNHVTANAGKQGQDTPLPTGPTMGGMVLSQAEQDALARAEAAAQKTIAARAANSTTAPVVDAPTRTDVGTTPSLATRHPVGTAAVSANAGKFPASLNAAQFVAIPASPSPTVDDEVKQETVTPAPAVATTPKTPEKTSAKLLSKEQVETLPKWVDRYQVQAPDGTLGYVGYDATTKTVIDSPRAVKFANSPLGAAAHGLGTAAGEQNSVPDALTHGTGEHAHTQYLNGMRVVGSTVTSQAHKKPVAKEAGTAAQNPSITLNTQKLDNAIDNATQTIKKTEEKIATIAENAAKKRTDKHFLNADDLQHLPQDVEIFKVTNQEGKEGFIAFDAHAGHTIAARETRIGKALQNTGRFLESAAEVDYAVLAKQSNLGPNASVRPESGKTYGDYCVLEKVKSPVVEVKKEPTKAVDATETDKKPDRLDRIINNTEKRVEQLATNGTNLLEKTVSLTENTPATTTEKPLPLITDQADLAKLPKDKNIKIYAVTTEDNKPAYLAWNTETDKPVVPKNGLGKLADRIATRIEEKAMGKAMDLTKSLNALGVTIEDPKQTMPSNDPIVGQKFHGICIEKEVKQPTSAPTTPAQKGAAPAEMKK